MMSSRKKYFPLGLTVSLMLSQCATAQGLHDSKLGGRQLEKETPAVDSASEHVTHRNLQLQGRAEILRNSDLESEGTDWNRIYSIGRLAYMDQDYSRAYNAFQLAKFRLRDLPPTDARVQVTDTALTLVANANKSIQAKAGYLIRTGVITKVFTGSLGWLAGLQPGDKVLSASLSANRISLRIERARKVYSIQLKEQAIVPLQGRTRSVDIDVATLDKNTDVLKKVTLFILIDKSRSMADSDSLPDGLSKWDWCRNQTKYFFEKQINSNLDVTIIPFDQSFGVIENADESKLKQVYKSMSPSDGTLIEGPLSFVLSKYILGTRSKPVLIAVITDGLPNDKEALRDLIFNTTLQLKTASDVCISFLQVGNSFEGSRTLTALDNDLVCAGAKFDIVKTISFDSLRALGLKRALIQVLLEQRSDHKPLANVN